MRISSLAAIALLGGCGGGGDPLPALADRIDCVLGGATDFTRECWAEWDQKGTTQYLVLHHGDGGFRRFQLVEDDLISADGAEPVQITPHDDQLEVVVGMDRYRLPLNELKRDAS